MTEAIFEEVQLPTYWASALINDDWSGYEEDEIGQIQDLLQLSDLKKYFCVDVKDDSGFQRCPSYWSASFGLLDGDYSTYVFQLR